MERKAFKKLVIKRDNLPMNFPHWVFLYMYIIIDNFGFHWQFWLGLVFAVLIFLVYIARKSVEITTNDKGRLLNDN